MALRKEGREEKTKPWVRNSLKTERKDYGWYTFLFIMFYLNKQVNLVREERGLNSAER